MVRGQKVNLDKGPATDAGSGFRFRTDAKIHNRFDVVLHNRVTGDSRQVAVGYNIICDSWWNRYNPGNQFSHIAYGRGSGTPSVADTDMFIRVGAGSATNNTWDESHFWTDGYLSLRREYTIPAGTLTGTEFTEVGIAYDGSAGHVVTHAMLEDMNGNPISITKGVDDDLTLYATVYLHVSPSGYGGGGIRWTEKSKARLNPLRSFFDWVLGIVSYTQFRDHVQALHAYGGSVPISLSPEAYSKNNWPGYVGFMSDVQATWTVGTKTLSLKNDATGGRIGSADINPNADVGYCIRGLAYGRSTATNYGGIELRIDLPVSGLGGMGSGEGNLGYVPISHLKNAGVVGTGDGTTKDFNTPFPFVKNDSSFKLFLNGIEQNPSDYTVDFDKPRTDNIGLYFNRLRGTYPILGANSIGPSTAGALAPVVGDYEIAENPFYGTYNITSFYRTNASYVEVYTSDDLETWTIIPGNGTVSVPAGQQGARYWKAIVVNALARGNRLDSFKSAALTENLTNLHCMTAPANGAIITHDAHYNCIPKSTATYFDIKVDIVLGEYVG